jgi:hypothetical protein
MKIQILSLFTLSFVAFLGNIQAQSWNLSGNAGTDPATMFIGTTDNKSFRIRTNNAIRMHINASGRVGIGNLSPVFKVDLKGGSYNTDSLYRINGVPVVSLGGGFVNTNIALGLNAMVSNSTGFQNAAVGQEALFSNTSGYFNVANGTFSLRSNTVGNYNTALGGGSLRSNITGSFNTAAGAEALANNASGEGNTSMGTFSLVSNISGNKNTAAGQSALFLNISGSNNTALGANALGNNSSGYSNVAIGVFALSQNTNRANLVAIGDSALYNNGLGATFSYDATDNTAVGSKALFANTRGDGNTATGKKALFSNTLGYFNTAVGSNSLSNNTTGYGNTAIGLSSLIFNVTGDYNLAVGLGADVSSGTLDNASAIGYNALVDASNKVRIGNTSVSSNGGQVGWSSFSDARIKNKVRENVPGLEFIELLRPVTYHFDVKKQNELMGKSDSERWNGKYDIEKIQFSGFIAQEVEAAAQKIGYDFSGVDKSGELYGLRYSEFVVPMVKAIQELQKQVEELKAELEIKNNTDAVKHGLNNDQTEIILGQNIPNPADNSTIIPFSIPSNCKSASILITEHTTGRVVKAIPLNCKETHLMLDAALLSAGTYTYSLYVDGNSIDTKQMVIVK